MKNVQVLLFYSLMVANALMAQEDMEKSDMVYKIPKQLLAGEGLEFIQQKDSTRKVYQKKVYDGESIAVYIMAIGTGITNEFDDFPMEEFIFWMNGKAVVEPEGENSFEVHSGDYFIQAKGFKGKWSFVDNGGLHLELALIAKERERLGVKSPISKALVIDRDILSGVSSSGQETEIVYEGAELKVNILHNKKMIFDQTSYERMFHVISGLVTVTNESSSLEKNFYPGDFFIVPEEFRGAWHSNSLQDLRVVEVFRSQLRK
ncbi:MAG: cupin domain-containing protein [Bacteroidota bacterium]